jgi:hypothetical protein
MSVPFTNRSSVMAVREGPRERGYIEGQNIVLELRFAEGDNDRFPELATPLAGLPVDVLVIPNIVGVAVAKQVTTTIPIVMTDVGDLWSEAQAAGRRMAIHLDGFEAGTPEQLRVALDRVAAHTTEAVLFIQHPLFFVQRGTIVAWAAAQHLPAMYFDVPFVGEGGLAAYSANVLAAATVRSPKSWS